MIALFLKAIALTSRVLERYNDFCTTLIHIVWDRDYEATIFAKWSYNLARWRVLIIRGNNL